MDETFEFTVSCYSSYLLRCATEFCFRTPDRRFWQAGSRVYVTDDFGNLIFLRHELHDES
jgi:hypothetical protein